MHLRPEKQSKQRQNHGQNRTDMGKKKADHKHLIADTF
jgi:hypothetical protein